MVESEHSSEHNDEIMTSKVRTNQSRGEKKSRKALLKLGLVRDETVTRVTIKIQKTLLVLQKPDVFRMPQTNTFVVFGDMVPQDLGSAMQQLLRAAAMTSQQAPAASAGAAAGVADLKDADVELVMEQASVSREAAIEALKSTGGDPVDAIMKLSPQ